jgi:hypothetical protein
MKFTQDGQRLRTLVKRFNAILRGCESRGYDPVDIEDYRVHVAPYMKRILGMV